MTAAGLKSAERPALAGTVVMSRHILRRDRVRMAVWLASITLFLVYFMVALTTVFDAAALQGRAAVMRTPTGIIMGGPGFGLDHYTGPVAVANEGTVYLVLALSLMSIFHVVRHTRADEESGLAELVRASIVGRHATAISTMLTLAGNLLVIAVVSGLAMVAAGSDVPVVDSLAMTLGASAVALVFGAVALVACQVSAHARTAIGISLGLFGAAFVVQAAGNVRQHGGSPLSWLSPIAWAQQSRAFVDLRWWPMLLSVAATAIALWLAAALSSHRDFGAGLVHARPGRPAARSSLRSPLALAWLQQRGALFWSTLGLALMWFGTGTLMSTIDDMVADLVKENAAFGKLFGTDPAQFASAFIGTMALFLAICAAAYAIAMGQRARGEETSGRLETVLATPVSRLRWLGSQIAVSVGGTVVLLTLSMIALWLGAVSVGMTDPGFNDYLGLLISYLPAVVIFSGLTFALYGWVPRAIVASWLLLAFVFVVGMFGPLLNLPTWVQAISPLYWVPADVGTISWPDVAGLTAVAAALIAIGCAGFRSRDIQA
ncbi:hypothetical protein [Gordonia sp. (in: high G+C Gram-positive bacteria)]|uniref:ABC transporter permease n=1 Tax=Gordonia sp. (in: high G+C Gram-positive bacteria) TaxID=84139 RepID=UPI0016A3183A|nr:hypothetical protein [Gordonia sp. (in: high G+C Gram-positive bacteria)]NLG45296.1 hypothetical protein [Gordonia sp. (in: high G+C Gram-positive bacteria)]